MRAATVLYAAIKTFLDARMREHPQIRPWIETWSPSLETQILLDTTGLEETGTGWTDDEGTIYRHIRIPHGADSNPCHHDQDLRYSPATRWQYFGTTGWNWQTRKSEWVGFDFDADDHRGGHADLRPVLEAAKKLPYVVARTSTGGRGIHLIVPVDHATPTHTAHAQLAKHVLARMSSDAGFDFGRYVDKAGGILWHWKRGLNETGLRKISYG